MTGRAFAVVGPSGAGKDSLMATAERLPGVMIVRRVITRPTEAGGEPFEAVTDEEFARRQAAGAFALDWTAHGLCYGIPRAAQQAQGQGQTVVMNLSRSVLAAAARAFPGLHVLEIAADPQVLAQRLAARGRETAADIAARLRRAEAPLDAAGLPVTRIDNSGDLALARAAFLDALSLPKANP